MDTKQLELEFLTPIDRDRGEAYVTFAGRVDAEICKLKFMDRYGFEPAEIFTEFGYTFVGPAPNRVEAMELEGGNDE